MASRQRQQRRRAERPRLDGRLGRARRHELPVESEPVRVLRELELQLVAALDRGDEVVGIERVSEALEASQQQGVRDVQLVRTRAAAPVRRRGRWDSSRPRSRAGVWPARCVVLSAASRALCGSTARPPLTVSSASSKLPLVYSSLREIGCGRNEPRASLRILRIDAQRQAVRERRVADVRRASAPRRPDAPRVATIHRSIDPAQPPSSSAPHRATASRAATLEMYVCGKSCNHFDDDGRRIEDRLREQRSDDGRQR